MCDRRIAGRPYDAPVVRAAMAGDKARHALKPALLSVAEPLEVPAVSSPVEVIVTEIRRGIEENTSRWGHVVVLAERDGERRLPMCIGRAEATALAVSLESWEAPRPMTYQLAASLVAAGGARITEVRITHLDGNTFYAVVTVNGPSGQCGVDARPSDALNVALVVGAPIRVEADLFDGACDIRWRDLGRDTASDLFDEELGMENRYREPPPARGRPPASGGERGNQTP